MPTKVSANAAAQGAAAQSVVVESVETAAANEAAGATPVVETQPVVETVEINGRAFPKTNVNVVTFELDRIGYAAADAEDENAVATFFLQARNKRVWSIARGKDVADAAGNIIHQPDMFTDASSAIMISEYSFMRAINHHLLLSKDALALAYREAGQDDPEDTRSVAERRREVLDEIGNAWANKFNGATIKVTQIRVPAGTPFVSPYGDAVVSTAHTYDSEKVFSYIEMIQLDITKADQRKVVKEIKDLHYAEDDGALFIWDLQESGVIKQFPKNMPERMLNIIEKSMDTKVVE